MFFIVVPFFGILNRTVSKSDQAHNRKHCTAKQDNARIQQQITTLKGEKTSLQQQILGLQRRIQEIEEQIGCD